ICMRYPGAWEETVAAWAIGSTAGLLDDPKSTKAPITAATKPRPAAARARTDRRRLRSNAGGTDSCAGNGALPAPGGGPKPGGGTEALTRSASAAELRHITRTNHARRLF